ncbi:MAG: 4-hydroxybenzoate octaprenyltransferase [Alphaproteobacteria bacterium]|nr:4-hydroxybenzoate octaprenyltransferase [Alphaproteobacteria bacterium]
MSNSRPDPGIIADARPTNWVDAYAPEFLKPYCKLARYDRPIGTWLLLLPCWFGQALAHLSAGQQWPDLWYAALFTVGALAMRGAGCTWNDIVDRDFDGRVERTALRPIPSGQVSVKQAMVFAVAQALVGLLVLVQFNGFTIWLAISSLVLVAAYPFAKRFTYWPQVVLGLTFNWGVLVGWASVTGELSATALMFYAGAVTWTIGYDTIYAHQDKEDDALLGLRSTALRFGRTTPWWLTVFYGLTLALFATAAYLAGGGLATFTGIGLVAGHFIWQIATLDIDDAANCLVRFKSNRTVGLILVGGILADMVLS